ncbi:interferon gamma receptor 1 isoform X1 [Pseudophryne corroboree]|uniref:interferon gamma receptor 1 isoform X1 n=1 Tax=Pseudophryne corroboree TaxID=495146 RepID=UPI003081A223
MAAASRVQHQAAALLLLSIALTAQANTARPDPTSGPLRVDKPFNLTMKSYNFNTTLYWDYIQTSVTPYFRVEINDYKISKWVVVKSCRNISRNYCDLSANIIEPYIYYNVRVKAFVGSNSSEYTKMEFCLITDGIIGPPTLNASVGEKMIVVDILHPYVPFIDEKKTVADYFEDLKYIIHYGNDTELTDDCDELGCTAKILTTNLNIYCISAQGVLDNDPMTMEQSKEICIEIVAAKDISKLMAIIFTSMILAIVLLGILAIYVFRKKTAATDKIPESLRTVVRTMAHRIMPSEPRTKYNHVAISPLESPEEKLWVEEENMDINVSPNSVSGESVEPGYQSSLTETEQISDEGQDGNAEEESSSDKYFRTNSSNNDNDSSVTPESEELQDNTKQEPPRDIKPVTNSCGYDKPHFPLDLLIQMSRENQEIEPSSSDDH